MGIGAEIVLVLLVVLPGPRSRERGFVLADLERFFHGHGITSSEPWFVQVIEPNLAGASAIAEHWNQLLTSQELPRACT